jgi:hypothetical protein
MFHFSIYSRDTVYISASVYGYIYIYHERPNIPNDTRGLSKHFNLSTENDYQSVVYRLTYVSTEVKF